MDHGASSYRRYLHGDEEAFAKIDFLWEDDLAQLHGLLNLPVE